MWSAIQKFRFVVLVAGRRFGKTTLAIIVLVISALSHKESTYWYVAPNYKQAKMIAWKMLKKLSPKFMVKKTNETELSIDYINNAKIELKGADNEDSLRGVGLWGMVIDEFASIHNNWDVWNEVLRPTLTDKQGWVLFIGTPKGKDAFHEIYLKGERKEHGYASFTFKTTDNPFIQASEVQEASKTMPERQFRQEYEASFEDFTGLIYPEFKESLHVIEPYEIPEYYQKIGAIDPALSGTTAALKAAIDEDNRLIVYSEFYEKDVRASEVAERIREDGVFWLIDPASASKSVQKEGKLFSLADEYTDAGIFTRPAENDVMAGINRVAEKFKANDIKIFKTCKNLIWEILRYHWAEEQETIRGVSEPRPYKKWDHLCFVAGTQIRVKNGTKNIEDINIGDYVYSSMGLQRVSDAQQTGKESIYEIVLSNGTKLQATKDHPIYTDDGIKRVDGLSYGDIMITWNQYITTEQNTIGTESIIRQSKAVRKVVRDCMLQFGNLITDLSQKACVFITSMVRGTTIDLKTCLAFHHPITQKLTQKKDLSAKNTGTETRNTLKESDPSLNLGTLQRREGLGIASTEEKPGLTKRSSSIPVNTVKTHLRRKIRNQSTAQTIVDQHSEEKMGLITLRNSVLSATKNTTSTNTPSKRPVHVIAVNRLEEKQLVYNLTVENSHNYFANDILVSNCDCLKYLCASRTSASEQEKPQIEMFSPQWYVERRKLKESQYV